MEEKLRRAALADEQTNWLFSRRQVQRSQSMLCLP
jgi:hypothetical protein